MANINIDLSKLNKITINDIEFTIQKDDIELVSSISSLKERNARAAGATTKENIDELKTLKKQMIKILTDALGMDCIEKLFGDIKPNFKALGAILNAVLTHIVGANVDYIAAEYE
jgi:hypothetical protein